MVDDIASDLSGDFKKLIIGLLQVQHACMCGRLLTLCLVLVVIMYVCHSLCFAHLHDLFVHRNALRDITLTKTMLKSLPNCCMRRVKEGV